MSDAAMREAMVRMATDTEFARRVRDDDGAAVARECGLSDGELAALQALAQADTPAGPTRMGERLSKSGLFGAGALAAAMHFGPAADLHGLLCDGHASLQCNGHALLCDGHSLLCNGHASLQCNGHALLCDGHSLLCDGHASIQCNDHSLVCDGHAGIQCDGHDATGVVKGDGHTDAKVVPGNGHEETGVVKCNAHAGIQCNGHLAELKISADLHPPVLGSLGVHSLLPPAAGAAPQ